MRQKKPTRPATKTEPKPRPNTPGRVHPGAVLKKPPPRNAAEIIREAAKSGASRTGVAVALGISLDLLKRWFAEFPALFEAFEQGRELERKTLHSKLHDMAMGGNVAAAIFLLKARHQGYIESGPPPDTPNRLSITFNLPGAMPLEQFVIENGTASTQRLPNNPADAARTD